MPQFIENLTRTATRQGWVQISPVARIGPLALALYSVFAAIFLIGCGNKGELFLDSRDVLIERLVPIDDALDELEEEEAQEALEAKEAAQVELQEQVADKVET